MIEIRRILCPTDFSGFSRHALEHAATLAGWYGAEITVLHLTPGLPAAAYAEYPASDALKEEGHTAVMEEAERFVRPAREAGIPVRVLVEEGSVTRKILRHAGALPADLLVMGTHGRGGFEHLVLGSVTEKILRRARCPVLTVPPPAAAVPPGAPLFKTILCAVDFSSSSTAGLRYALSLAEEADARLILLHVLDWLPEEPEGRTPAWQAELEAAKPAAEERLRQAVPDEAREACRPEELVVTGRAWREILRVAAQEGAEIIVLGVQGRGVIDLALFGSTANHIVRSASCPVLTVRAE